MNSAIVSILATLLGGTASASAADRGSIPQAFALMACAATSIFKAHDMETCAVVERYDTLTECEIDMASLQAFWKAHSRPPVPVHCEDRRT